MESYVDTHKHKTAQHSKWSVYDINVLSFFAYICKITTIGHSLKNLLSHIF